MVGGGLSKEVQLFKILTRNLPQGNEVFSEHDFSKPRRMLTLYRLRYESGDMSSQDLDDLTQLCEELRAALFETMISDWSSIPAFAALVEERLLCCTGDPALRRDSCWERRPRKTMLDFGWTRIAPQMPTQWKFFANCKPTTLLSILIETTEAVKTKAEELMVFTYPKGHAWSEITFDDVLRRCYERSIWTQPTQDDFDTYAEHAFYVLAAIETSNIFFRSSRVDIQAFSGLFDRSPNSLLHTQIAKTIEDTMLSTTNPHPMRIGRGNKISLVEHDLPPDLRNEVFPPQHLNFQSLMRLGFLQIRWTEYLEDHLQFDASSSEVKIFWFASHIRAGWNHSYQ
jgi:hypothetical protein